MAFFASLSRAAATRWWLGIIDFVGLVTIYELAAINHFHNWHTISYFAQIDHWIGYVILALGVATLGFWFWHFHQTPTWFKLKVWWAYWWPHRAWMKLHGWYYDPVQQIWWKKHKKECG